MMLDEMRAFVLLAETGSIQRVAERLPLTQPAVTRQIQRLEQHLGTTLLDRRVKPPRLTPAGLAALDRCRAILAAVQDLKAGTGEAAEPEGPLRLGVGVLHAFAEADFAALMRGLRQRYPRLSLRLTGGLAHTLLTDLDRGRLDAAVVLLQESAAPYPGRVVGQEKLVVVGARSLALPRRPSLADLAACDWVVSPRDSCDVRPALEALFAREGLELRISAEVHDLAIQQSLIRSGFGLGVLPTRRCAPFTARDELRRIDLPGFRFDFAISVVRAPHLGRLDRAVDHLEDGLRQRLAPAVVPMPQAVT
jgi:DNA-binding transcriptional LysR family regulator